MKSITMSIILVLFSALSANAEVALLCGNDLDAIYNNNSKAAVHVDFDDRVIANKDEVKFLSVFGLDRDIKFARMVEGAKIFVRTEKESFLFSKIESCDGEGAQATVKISTGETYNCSCHED